MVLLSPIPCSSLGDSALTGVLWWCEQASAVLLFEDIAEPRRWVVQLQVLQRQQEQAVDTVRLLLTPLHHPACCLGRPLQNVAASLLHRRKASCSR